MRRREHDEQSGADAAMAGAAGSGTGAQGAGTGLRRPHADAKALAAMAINVAVAGRSGSGKSSFINTLRDLAPGDAGAAAVGVCETTMRPTCYDVPRMPSFKLWDIPGSDTKEFASETYVKAMGLTHFDMVVIIVQSPLVGTEQTITVELQRCGIPHFVVRSKVDIDIDNNLYDFDIPEHETLANIRSDMLKHGIAKPYLISSRRPHALDIDHLMHDIMQAAREKGADLSAPRA